MAPKPSASGGGGQNHRKRPVFSDLPPPPATRQRTGIAPSSAPGRGAIVSSGPSLIFNAFGMSGLPPPPAYLAFPPMQGVRRFRGRVISYDQEKGYGFVVSPEVPEDIYFQKRELPEQMKQRELKNAGVEFEVILMPDGKPRALHIAFLEMPRGGGGNDRDRKERNRDRDRGNNDHAASLPPVDPAVVDEMTRFLEERGGAFDFGKFSGKFKLVRKAQLEEHFRFIRYEDHRKSGRGWQILLPGVDPLPPSERQDGGALPTERGRNAGEDTPIGHFEGTIHAYDDKNGYGFIQSPDVPEGDVYFKKSVLPPNFRNSLRSTLLNLVVEFDGFLTADGKARADNVTVIGEPPAAEGKENNKKGGNERPAPEDLPELSAETIDDMRAFLEEKGGCTDYGKFANRFSGIKKAQLLPHDAHFTLIQQGDRSEGRWLITLFGVDPPAQEEGVEKISVEKKEKRERAPQLVIQPSDSLFLIGCIKKWDPKKQFGFIVADGADDVFVHRNDLPECLHGLRNMMGVELSFELGESEDGKPRVLQARPLIQPDGRGGWQLRRRQP